MIKDIKTGTDPIPIAIYGDVRCDVCCSVSDNKLCVRMLHENKGPLMHCMVAGVSWLVLSEVEVYKFADIMVLIVNFCEVGINRIFS
jgi:hypothetical protein